MVETQGPTVDAVSIAFGVLTLVSISLRLWARIFVVKSLGIDDCEYRNIHIGVDLGDMKLTKMIVDLICIAAVS